MIRWLISVPVWGEHHVNVFCSTALPALERAITALVQHDKSLDVRLIVHTDIDQMNRIKAAASSIKLETRPVPAGLRDYDCLSQAHREVIQMACLDDRVVFLTSDLVISEFGLKSCDELLTDNRVRLICCLGMRAVEEGQLPSTTSSRRLLEWAWSNRHPTTEDSRWPNGHVYDMSRLYFEDESKENVVAHLALPHPLVVRIDGRVLSFTPTVDVNLIQNFTESEIRLVTDPGVLALVELSPRDRIFHNTNRTIAERMSVKPTQRVPDPLQRWLFQHKVVVKGKAVDCGDDDLIRAMKGLDAR